MRPTGRLHIGHYFGALANWIRLQNDSTYECFYFVADWHALTSDYADPSQIASNTIEIVTDWLAVGLDPAKSIFFVQSQVPEHAELHLLLSMITPLGRLYSLPSYKEQLENIKDKDLQTYGFLGYPVLQCADIVIYSETGSDLVVPVGEDQKSHVELSREIVRRANFCYAFNLRADLFEPKNRQSLRAILELYAMAKLLPVTQGVLDQQTITEIRGVLLGDAKDGGIRNFVEKIGPENRRFVVDQEILTEPDALLTETPRIPGLDGRKMSKSYGNAIMLSEDDESIRAKTKVMVTDPARKRRTDPGNPDICPVYDWHKLFSPPETLDWSAHGCRTAGIGCIECKAAMADNLIKWITPVRARRQQYEAHPEKVREILADGSKKARKVAQATMERVRQAVFGATVISSSNTVSIASDVGPAAKPSAGKPSAAKPSGAGN
ncbi:MAG: tryptophan--tRNA ligase [Acidipila sp.]|nr:tryptophan--tRNA ligase [Acidipila sp.]